MALKGDLRSLRNLKRMLSNLPITTAALIARSSAPEVSALAREAFDGGRTVYGSTRPRGVDGRELTLVKSGASRRAVRFEATGTQMRTAVLPRYTRYLIGKYDVLPNGPLPAVWRERMTEIAARILQRQLAERDAP